MSAFNLDQKQMNVVKTAAAGVVNSETIFSFRQKDGIVSAEYAGGDIVKGCLIGVLRGADLTFRYCQIDRSGNLDGGISKGALSRLSDGRIAMVESFQWSHGAGDNIFEEMLSSA